MGLGENNLNNWLNSNDGLGFLKTCAKKILRNPVHRNLAQKTLNDALYFEFAENLKTTPPKPADLKSETRMEGTGSDWRQSNNEMCNILVGELCIFISDRPGMRAGLKGLILQDSPAKACSLLTTAFVWHMKDLLRRRSEEPWYGYYRKAAKTLAEQEDFTFHATSRGSFFAACGISGTLMPFAPETIIGSGFEHWPYPQVPDNIPSREALICWAYFFYNHLKSMIGYDCLVPVRDFVNYVMAKGGLNWTNVRHVYLDQPSEDNKNICLPELFVQDNTPGPGPEQMMDLAQNLFEGWSEKQRAAFCMKYYEELTLNTIAEKLGYAGASGVSALLNSVKDSLLETLSAWPGLSPPDLNENLCDEFMTRLLSFCKKIPKNRKYYEEP